VAPWHYVFSPQYGKFHFPKTSKPRANK
jgi:hypothetical protein